MTVSKVDHPVLPDDPQASLRLELVGQLVAAQFALEGALAEFAGNSGALGQAQLQLTMLATLRQQIGTASPATLSAMSNEIVAAVAQTQSVIQQGRANLANSESSSASGTAKARQLMQSVADDVFRQKLLDPYLQFATAEDEAAYRKREQERSVAYDDQIAKQTVEGNSRARSILQSQLADAKAHGAHRSPDMAAIEQQLAEAAQNLQPRASDREKAATADVVPVGTTAHATDDELGDVMAALKAAGVAYGAGNAPSGKHGVTNVAVSTATPDKSVVRS